MAEPDAEKRGVFDEERILRIVELMKEHDLQEVDLREAERQIRIKRNPGPGQMPVSAPYVAPPAAAAAPAPAAAAPEADDLITIRAPMVGTFYGRPNPNASSYVKVGDHVEPETTICIIEAMKVFNEIPAEVRGKVMAVLVDEEEPVEYGTPLFKIDPNG